MINVKVVITAIYFYTRDILYSPISLIAYMFTQLLQFYVFSWKDYIQLFLLHFSATRFVDCGIWQPFQY